MRQRDKQQAPQSADEQSAGASCGRGRSSLPCLAMAGASEPINLAAARDYEHPFLHAVFTTDAHAACIGAHGARDGGIIIVGTGSAGLALLGGTVHRVGGWGFPVSDEEAGHGSAARQRVAFCGPMTDAFHGPVYCKSCTSALSAIRIGLCAGWVLRFRVTLGALLHWSSTTRRTMIQRRASCCAWPRDTST